MVTKTTMSRLDKLLDLVDDLEHKSDTLIQSMAESSRIMNHITCNQESVSCMDNKINQCHSVIGSNHMATQAINDLWYKSYLFENSVHHNDGFTNDNILHNLRDEFRFVGKKYDCFDSGGGGDSIRNEVSECGSVLDQGISSPDLHNLHDDVHDDLHHSHHDSHEADSYIEDLHHSHHQDHTTKTLPKSISISQLNLKPIRCKSNKVYKKKSHYRISKAFDNINPISPGEVEENDSPKRIDSGTTSGSDSAIFDTTPEFESGDTLDYDDDAMTIKNTFGDDNFIQTIDDIPDLEAIGDADSPLKSTFDHSLDADNQSTLSLSDDEEDLPKYSSIENFHHFLRKSRINLSSTSYPYAIRNSVSEASLQPPQESLSPTANKFHNPIDKIKQKGDLVKPTVESIYSKFNAHEPPQKSETLLNEVINHTPKKLFSLFNFGLSSPDKTTETASITPTSIKGITSELPQPTKRRNSFMGSSLTESLLLLVSQDKDDQKGLDNCLSSCLISCLSSCNTRINTHLNSFTNPSPSPRQQYKQRKTNHLKKLKEVPRSHPILIQADNRIKRLPPNGSYSDLVIDSNKSFVLDHGNSSVFKKPIMTNFSNRSLQDALHTNLSC